MGTVQLTVIMQHLQLPIAIKSKKIKGEEDGAMQRNMATRELFLTPCQRRFNVFYIQQVWRHKTAVPTFSLKMYTLSRCEHTTPYRKHSWSFQSKGCACKRGMDITPWAITMATTRVSGHVHPFFAKCSSSVVTRLFFPLVFFCLFTFFFFFSQRVLSCQGQCINYTETQ